MKVDSKIKVIYELLDEGDLLNRSGSVLYSGDETIKDGDWYFLGSNPGGHDDEKGVDTVKNQLLKFEKPKTFNEYFEGVWTNPHHQDNIKLFFDDLNLNLKEILSTNLCFVRSSEESTYTSVYEKKTPKEQRREDNEKCWKVHEYLLSEVKPKFIICNGTTSRNFIVKIGKTGRYGKKFKNKMEFTHYEEEIITIGGLKCTFHRGDFHLFRREICLKDIGLFSVPHLGRYTYYPKSTNWIKKIMDSQFGIVL